VRSDRKSSNFNTSTISQTSNNLTTVQEKEI